MPAPVPSVATRIMVTVLGVEIEVITEVVKGKRAGPIGSGKGKTGRR